jgi:hypothetical protein
MLLQLNDTELQMVHEGLKRAKPFADLSPELREAEAALEARILTKLEARK